jgi:hypothetical protein
MQQMITAVIVSIGLVVQAGGEPVETRRTAQATSAETSPGAIEPMPGKRVVGAATMRGTIGAIDKDKGTVTLKGPKGGTLTLEVRDRQKLDAVKVGDPVVAVYMEALGFQARKAGTASPGTTMQESRVTSPPGETPAGAIGREITVTGTITAIDRKAQTVTIKGSTGETETIKAREPKNLDAVKVGDLVDVTYTQALAISLDTSPE